MKRLRLCLWLLALLLPASTLQADGGLPPTPQPYPPLTLPALSSNSANAPSDLVQLAPFQDAFVANGISRVRRYGFGKENVLYVGKYDDILSEMHTLVGYHWQPPPKFLDIIEATLYFGVGDGADADMPVAIYNFNSPFNEETVSWDTAGWWGKGPANGVLGPVGYWSRLDVTPLLKNTTDFSYLGFRIRPTQLAYHFYKATYSREGSPELAPQLVLRYRIDNIAPQVWFQDIKPWASTRYDRFAIYGVDAPDPRRDVSLELQYRLDDGPWQTLDTPFGRDWIYYPPAPGSIATIRLRGRDGLGNTSEWVYTPPIKLYSFDLQGRITDHRERILPPKDPNISPEPWWVSLHDDTQTFVARLKTVDKLAASAHVPGYGSWEDEPLYSGSLPITITLPPADNLMAEELSEDAAQWRTNAEEDQLAHGDIGQGQGSLKLSATAGLRLPALFCSQTYYDLSELNQPTIGVHYWYGSYPHDRYLYLLWQDDEGHFYPLTRAAWAGPYEADWYNAFWNYAWADLTPYRSRRGRLCLEMTRPSYWGEYTVFLDRFSLGSTPSDLSLALHLPDPLPDPGQSFQADLVVQNRSPYTATAQLRLSLGNEAEERILLPVLAVGETLTHTLPLTVPVAHDFLRLGAIVGKPEIDRTPEDNEVHWLIFTEPYQLFLPQITRGPS
ncbi:MAG: DNRLRE domain-containing protein [Chloroflexi bacterium]|nr:DNRLRE domain-containing protein [Chloroflexota bacterium]